MGIDVWKIWLMRMLSTVKSNNHLFYSPRFCGLLLFSGSAVYHECYFSAIFIVFFEYTHGPALPHVAVKKIMLCIAINQPPVAASKQAAVCF